MSRRVVTDAQRRARLVRAHRLSATTRTDDVTAVADSLVALHSSDPATVHLSAMARLRRPDLATTAAALYEQRSLLRHHAMRRTLWVGTLATVRVLHAACTLEVAAAEDRKLLGWVAASGLGVDPVGWLQDARARLLDALARHGPISARALGVLEPELTTPLRVGGGSTFGWQPAHTRLLLHLGFSGEAVRTAPTASWLSSEYQWALTSDWVPGGIVGADPAGSRAELVRRYLAAFGPATTADVRWWTGLGARAVAAALAGAGGVEVGLEDGSAGWLAAGDPVLDDGPTVGPDAVDVPDPGDEPDPSEVVLLPGLDPTPMGWKERGFYLGDLGAFGGPLFDRNGNVGPTVWSGGRVVGGWAQRGDGTVVHELLVPVDAAVRGAVGQEGERLTELLDGVRVTPRFPTPLQRALVAG